MKAETNRPDSTIAHHVTRQGARTARRSTHRHDLDGLRAFAILLVVAYHVWVGRVSGGVDVFLLLSAYFLTSSLVRKAERGTMGLGAYWINRFWRLVPVAALTIGGVLIMTYFVMPAFSWESIWNQSWASLFYWQNWELASSSVDYYARGVDEVSPLLHFWSLSVQGQVFILWPLLLAGCLAIARLTKLRVRTIALVVFSTIFVVSMVYSIMTTATNQTVAYYDTGARLWEFALGSLAALLPVFKNVPRVIAEVISWTAILALLMCGVLLDVSGGFPGYLALWPTLATVAIVYVGGQAKSFSTVVGSRPMRWLGKIAYPLYLVHWPILVAVMVSTGNPRPSLRVGTAIIIASLLLATVVHYLVDRPLQRFRFEGKRVVAGLVALAVAVSVVAVPLTMWRAQEEQQAAALAASTDYPGAEILDVVLGDLNQDVGFVPLGSQLSAEWASLDEPCASRYLPAGLESQKGCFQSIVADDAPLLVIAGDSHAQQWMAALHPIAAARGYNVVALLKGGCAFALDEYTGGDETGCAQWRDETVEYINDIKPEILAIVGTRVRAAEDADETEMAGLEETLAAVQSSVGQFVLLRDNPRFDENKFVCVQENLEDPNVCGVPIRRVLAEENPIQYLDSPTTNIVDMSDYFCPDEFCDAVIGNVVVYMDDNHVTKTYMQTMTNPLTRRLQEAGLQWQEP